MASKFIDNSKYRLHLLDLTSDLDKILPPIEGFEKQPLVSLEKAAEPLVSIVSQVKHMVSIVKKIDDQPKDHLSIDESASIRLYTLGWKTIQTSFGYILNKVLRSENRDELVPWFLYLRLFLHALAKLPAAPCRIFFCETNDDVTHEYPEGRIFIWWDFLSCTSSIKSLEESYDKHDVRTIFMIESDSAKDISQHSFYETQNDILLYPARQYQTVSSYCSNNRLKLIHLKEVQSLSPLIHIPAVSSIKHTSFIAYHNEHLQSIIDKCRPYSEIDLHSQNLIDDDMTIVVQQAILNKKCKELWLQTNKITSVGASVLARGLNNNTTVEVLILHDNHIGDVGIRSLVRILSYNKSIIKVLGLESVGMTDEGAGYIADMLKTNKTLTSLGLGENSIGDRGVHLLSTALNLRNNTLREIYLLKNKKITDTSVDYLAQMLKHNRTLSRLWIDDCNLSLKGKERLRQSVHSKNRFSLSV